MEQMYQMVGGGQVVAGSPGLQALGRTVGLAAKSLQALPPVVHLASGLISSVPQPAMVVLLTLAAASLATGGASFMQRHFPRLVPFLQRAPYLRHLLPANAHDSIFVTMYVAAVIIMALMLGLISLVSLRVPWAALSSVLVGSLGVAMSVQMEGLLCAVDPPDLAQAEASAAGTRARRMFLRAPMGLALATAVLAAPSLCPISITAAAG